MYRRIHIHIHAFCLVFLRAKIKLALVLHRCNGENLEVLFELQRLAEKFVAGGVQKTRSKQKIAKHNGRTIHETQNSPETNMWPCFSQNFDGTIVWVPDQTFFFTSSWLSGAWFISRAWHSIYLYFHICQCVTHVLSPRVSWGTKNVTCILWVPWTSLKTFSDNIKNFKTICAVLCVTFFRIVHVSPWLSKKASPVKVVNCIVKGLVLAKQRSTWSRLALIRSVPGSRWIETGWVADSET